MKALRFNIFQRRFGVAVVALLLLAGALGTSVSKGDGVGFVTPQQFNTYAKSVNGQINQLSSKLNGLNTSVQDLSSTVTSLRQDFLNAKEAGVQTPNEQPATDAAALSQTVQQKVESALANKIKSEVAKEVASASGTFTEQVGQLQQKVEANGSGVDQKITPLATQLTQVISDVAALKARPLVAVAPAAPVTHEAGMPSMIWVLLGVNLLFGAGALVAALLLLQSRGSVAAQVQKAVQDQRAELTKSLVQKIEPSLNETINQGRNLVGELQKAVKNHQELLNAMSTNVDQCVAKVGVDTQKAFQTLFAEAQKNLGNLKQDAAKQLDEIFQGVREKLRSETGGEITKVKEDWAATLNNSQKEWQKRLEGEIASLKETWLRQMDEQHKLWQSRLSTFMETQPESWQKRLDQAAKKSEATWDLQLTGLQGKVEKLWGGIDQRLAEAQVQITDLNEKITASYERLKLRDDTIAALIWPAFFQEGDPMLKWKKKIEDRMAQHDPAALGLFLALGAFNKISRDPLDLRKLAEALNGVGVEAYRFWKSESEVELDAALEWRSAFQGYLDGAQIPMDIITVFERTDFNTDTMLAVDSGRSTRMYVKEVLSWIVRDKSGEAPKVLYHARVTTT
jgi:outer membrane murein-binding lipoprotein Lpp